MFNYKMKTETQLKEFKRDRSNKVGEHLKILGIKSI